MGVHRQPVIDALVVCWYAGQSGAGLMIKPIARDIPGKRPGEEVVIVGIGFLVRPDTNKDFFQAGVALAFENKLPIRRARFVS